MSGSFWRQGALPAALGSLLSLAAQATMALFLLRLFEPAAVGLFSVVSQVAFGWATLALAQSPLSLLANAHLPPLPAARQAWQASLWRWLWLGPLAALALWWASRAGDTGAWSPALLWTAALAACQLSWLLAQSLALRTGGACSIAAVRVLPPALAAALAALAALAAQWRDSHALLAAALAGYLAGALWLWPLRSAPHGASSTAGTAGAAAVPESTPAPDAAVGDARSDRLKLAHSFSDVLLATALASHWAWLYGPAQAGCLLLLLRVMGFVPALVGSAWAQVVLSRPDQRRPPSWLAALAAVLALLVLVLLVRVALAQGWLAPAWQGLLPLLWPLALWQAAASLTAAVSHRPLRFGQARSLSWQCLGINAVQAVLLLAPPLWGWSMLAHLWGMALWLAVALGAQALWAARLRQG